MNIKDEKARFLSEVVLSNSVTSALQRGKRIFVEEPNESLHAAFVAELKGALREQAEQYRNNSSMPEREHANAIDQMANDLSDRFGAVLHAGRLRIGRVQKALNLFLKFLWCIETDFPTPPHCPLDRIVLERASIPGNWTELDSIVTYNEWVSLLRARAAAEKFPSLAVWELCSWNQKVNT